MKFIEKVRGSLYYLAPGGMGCYGDPPEHPNHKYHIVEKRGGVECGSCSIEYVACDPRDTYYKTYAPKVFAMCKRLMDNYAAKKST